MHEKVLLNKKNGMVVMLLSVLYLFATQQAVSYSCFTLPRL